MTNRIEYRITSKGKISFTSKIDFSGIGFKKVSVQPCGGTFYIATEKAFEKIQLEHETVMN